MLNELLDSRNQAGPSLSVPFAIIGHWRQPTVRNLHLGAARDGRQFPTNQGLVERIRVPACKPGIGQHSWRIEFQDLAMVKKLYAGMFTRSSGFLGHERPLSTKPRFHLPLC